VLALWLLHLLLHPLIALALDANSWRRG